MRNNRSTEEKMERALYTVRHFLIIFVLISFVVTCSALVLLDSMSLDPEMMQKNAPRAFLNVVFLSVVFWVLDGMRNLRRVERPVTQIKNAMERVMQGDFSVRLETLDGGSNTNQFNHIIMGLNQMVEELSSVETLRTDFISNVSHELKTPLAVIQNYGTMLQKPNLSDEQRLEYAKAVTDASKRLANLITNILKLNKLENQQIFPEMKEYNLGEQLCECMLGFEDAWEKKDIEIDTDIEEDVIVAQDAELLSLVWNNLISNAIKFTEEKGSIRLSLEKEGDWAVVQVQDTGCGIDASTGKHIFEKFYQGDTSHATQGNGLGLALVKRVVDIVGGEIAVRSELGVGSTFSVRLRMTTGRKIDSQQ